MTLQALATDEDVNQAVVDQVVLPVERSELAVEHGRLAAALRCFIALNPVWLSSNFVKAMIDRHVPIPNSCQLAAQRSVVAKSIASQVVCLENQSLRAVSSPKSSRSRKVKQE